MTLGSWLGYLLGMYLLGILTGIVGVSYVQSKARSEDGYNPWEPK
jgi:F0F1-type ATP synthase membrane subunit c/vacuolar-type H+-ATPase subunit K